jgi:hypothetical protein
MSGFIYFIGSPAMNAIKLGFTASHPRTRLKALQTGSADELMLYGWSAGTMEDERRFHLIFSDYRIHGEWFRRAGEFEKFFEAFLAHYWKPFAEGRSA